MDDIPFQCTSCGACCKNANFAHVNREYWGLEMTEEGHCTNLTPDGKCKIYETRPLICRNEEIYDNLEKIKEAEPMIYELIKTYESKKDYYNALHDVCDILMDKYGVDPSYRIIREKENDGK